MRKKIFFQENDTKISDLHDMHFDSRAFFSEAMSFSKFAYFESKVMIEVMRDFFE